MKMALGVALVFLAGCGSSTTPPPSTPAPEAAPPATTGCTAENTIIYLTPTAVPAGWRLVGSLEMVVSGKPEPGGTHFDAMIVKSAAGKTVLEKPLHEPDWKTERDFRHEVAQGMCAVGGAAIIGTLGGRTEKELDAELASKGKTHLQESVIAPVREDEAADVALLCTKPPNLDVGAAQDADERTTRAYFDGQTRFRFLTSRKWRTFMRVLGDANGREPIRQAGRELADAARAAGKSTCWYAETMQAM